jgi:hypothetical protein
MAMASMVTASTVTASTVTATAMEKPANPVKREVIKAKSTDKPKQIFTLLKSP